MFITFLVFVSKYLTGRSLVEKVFILAYILKAYSPSWQDGKYGSRRDSWSHCCCSHEAEERPGPGL